MISVLIGGEWSASRPRRFTLVEGAHRTHWIGGRVGPRFGLDDKAKRKLLTLLTRTPTPVAIPTAQIIYLMSNNNNNQIKQQQTMQ
jgi:hypothetical protein